MEQIILPLLIALAAYAALGAVAAAALHAKGLKAIDPGVAGAGFFFRLLVTPGIVALWPWLLLRWKRAAAGDAEPPAPDAFVAPRKTRALHGFLVVAIGASVPVLAAFALTSREASHAPFVANAGYLLREPVAAKFVAKDERLFEGLGGAAAAFYLHEETGARLLELTFDRDLLRPSLALYWLPKGGGEEKIPEGVFLGSVWGPGQRRYWLPAGAGDRARGTYLVYSLAKGETIFETEGP